MDTTAIYPNRVSDKAKLEAKLRLPEFPELYTKGTVVFYTADDTLISVGYTRIVYGDHGPYVEFDKSTVNFDAFTFKKKSEHAWYDEWYSKDSTRTMLYDQKKGVEMLSNPPAGAHSYRGNRTGGYADYVVGMIYVDPYKCKLMCRPHTEDIPSSKPTYCGNCGARLLGVLEVPNVCNNCYNEFHSGGWDCGTPGAILDIPVYTHKPTESEIAKNKQFGPEF
jgi:hypothetical protein